MPSIVRDLEHKIFVCPYSHLELRDRSVVQLLDIEESTYIRLANITHKNWTADKEN